MTIHFSTSARFCSFLERGSSWHPIRPKKTGKEGSSILRWAKLTWDVGSRLQFEEYRYVYRTLSIYLSGSWVNIDALLIGSRDDVERRWNFKGEGLRPGNQKRRFRASERCCTLGENAGLTTPCHIPQRKLCECIVSGFGPYLRAKQNDRQ